MNRPFEWGSWDCALWAAAAIEAMTGHDLAEDLRGQYSSETEAAEILRDIGAGNLYNLARRHLGQPIHPSAAWRGDVAYFRRSLGICYGPHALFVGHHVLASGEETPEGLIVVPIDMIERAFKVR